MASPLIFSQPPTRSPRLIFREDDVMSPVGLRMNDAYDLHLYEEMGNPSRGVLEVRMTVQFQFQDDGKSAATKQPLPPWTGEEKAQFARRYKEAIEAAWSDKHLITTDSKVPRIREVRVAFKVRTLIDGWHLDDHYEVQVSKTEKWDSPLPNTKVDGRPYRPADFPFHPSGRGNVELNSMALDYHEYGGGLRLRPAVHEFGHMLGFRDEYPDAKAYQNPHWLGDRESIMHSGEKIQERHYAPFAYWLTRQYLPRSVVNLQSIPFKVNGRIDLLNAML